MDSTCAIPVAFMPQPLLCDAAWEMAAKFGGIPASLKELILSLEVGPNLIKASEGLSATYWIRDFQLDERISLLGRSTNRGDGGVFCKINYKGGILEPLAKDKCYLLPEEQRAEVIVDEGFTGSGPIRVGIWNLDKRPILDLRRRLVVNTDATPYKVAQTAIVSRQDVPSGEALTALSRHKTQMKDWQSRVRA
ncbi:Uncharacterised protein [uncultured archaeon]|nr:Uncharacterised protein [uncultured archaeon]